MTELSLTPPPLIAGLEVRRSLELQQQGHVEVTTVQGVASTDFVYRDVDIRRIVLVEPDPPGKTSRITFETAQQSYTPSNMVHGDRLRVLPASSFTRHLSYEGRTYVATPRGQILALEPSDGQVPSVDRPPEIDPDLLHGVDFIHPDGESADIARTALGPVLKGFLFRELTGGVVAGPIIDHRFQTPTLQTPSTKNGGATFVYPFDLDASEEVAAGGATLEGRGHVTFQSNRFPAEFVFEGSYVTAGGGLSHEQRGRGSVSLRVEWGYEVPD